MPNKRPRVRRTKAQTTLLREAIRKIIDEHRPLTVRHLFYLLVGTGLIEKSEAEYNGVVIRLAGEMREMWLKREQGEIEDDGSAVIPFGREYIVDAGRWVRKPESHASLEDHLRDSAEFYRRSLWADQNAYVAFFVEKDAVAEIVYQETSEWDVPLAVMRGDCSKPLVGKRQGHRSRRQACPSVFFGDDGTPGVVKSSNQR